MPEEYSFKRNPFKIPHLTPFELGYIAGFIDGEGCLSFSTYRDKNGRPKRCEPFIQISNVDPSPIEFIHRKLKVPWKLHQQRRQTLLSFDGFRKVKELLELLTPHLIVKKEQAKLMLKLLNQHKFRAWSLSDWELVLQHAEANKVSTHPRHLSRIKELKSFIKELKT